MAEAVRLGDLTHEQLDVLAADPRWSLCWAHGVAESLMNGEPYVVCGECGHVFQTPQDLVASYQRDVDHEWDGPPHEIAFCPECVHDF